jgi:hypothetical protein
VGLAAGEAGPLRDCRQTIADRGEAFAYVETIAASANKSENNGCIMADVTKSPPGPKRQLVRAGPFA